ncbi:MAG: hypothetical protein GY731_03910, partial [Gammaproteobacteria bacterium]|nr:hypothetical protein [Gammaproteobacteria bacterium]
MVDTVTVFKGASISRIPITGDTNLLVREGAIPLVVDKQIDFLPAGFFNDQADSFEKTTLHIRVKLNF